MAEKPTTPAAEGKPAKRGMSMKIVLLVILLVGGLSAGGTWFMFGRKAADAAAAPVDAEGHAAAPAEGHGDEHGAAPKKPGEAQYLALDPAFVVNTADEDSQHYLQTDVQVMSRNGDALEAVKTHMPRIRNNLLMLFGQQKTTDIRDRAGRERLQAAALKEVQAVLQAETGKPGVEAVYFTSFVTQ
jgi:flagellar FliL protein